MSATCDRHPTQSAWWHCPRCRKYLCPKCITKRKGGNLQIQTFYFCPKCNVEVNAQKLSQVIAPFWMRLHKFFVYPFSSVQSIGMILALALLSTFFSTPGLMSMLLRFVLWAVMVKYSFEALKTTAEGYFKPPSLSNKVLFENFDIVFKQIALYFVLFIILVFFAVKGGMGVVALSVLVGSIVFPSMLILLIINENLGHALNPVMFIGLISRIGWSYFLLLFFLLLLSGAPAALGYAVIQHLPEKLQLFMITAAKNYYTLITYHLMGYVILQYHHRVDYPVELETLLASMHPMVSSTPEQQENAEENSRHNDLLNEISLMSQEGDLDGAIAKIEERVDFAEIKDLELSERYIGLLRIQKRRAEFLDYAPNHLELLTRSGSKSKATKLYIECLRMKKSFAPRPLVLFKISGWLNESNKNKTAIFALNSLINSYPKDMLVPKAYYRAAQIFHERLKNAEQAKKILNRLLRNFPDHEMSSFAKNYLSNLQRSAYDCYG